MQDNQNKTIERIGELLSKNYPARVVEGETRRMALGRRSNCSKRLPRWNEYMVNNRRKLNLQRIRARPSELTINQGDSIVVAFFFSTSRRRRPVCWSPFLLACWREERSCVRNSVQIPAST